MTHNAIAMHARRACLTMARETMKRAWRHARAANVCRERKDFAGAMWHGRAARQLAGEAVQHRHVALTMKSASATWARLG